MADEPHTIVASERAWAGRVVAIISICDTITAVFALSLWPFSIPVALLVWVTLFLAAIVIRHLARGEITIGLIPIAISTVGPVALAAYLDKGNLWGLAGAVAGFGMAGFTLSWFARMDRATHPQLDEADQGTAIVLGCAVKRGRPTPTLELRLEAARQLWLRHPNIVFIVTGGVSDPRERSEAAVMADWLSDAGVPADKIVVEDRALNTEENLSNARTLIGERGLPSPIWLVTSDYHMWRAAGIARGVGIETVPCAAKTPSSSRLVQWCREVLVICFGS